MRDREQVIGRWEREFAPLTDKLELPGSMGLEVRLQPDAALAMGEAVVRLARLLDLEEAHHTATMQLIKALACTLALIGVGILMAVSA